MRERGQAMMKEAKMAEVMKKFANYSVKSNIKSCEDCNLDFVLCDLRKVVVGMEADIINEDNYILAAEQFKKEYPEIEDREHRQKQAEEMAPPPLAEPMLEVESIDQVFDAETHRQRKAIKAFKVGDQVEVYSVKNDCWMLDGEVTEDVSETCTKDGVKVRAGSMKIVYAEGKQFKWLPPSLFGTHVRESLRPRPVNPLAGEFMKQTHNWLSEWHTRYFVVKKGFLQWWMS